MAARLLDFAVVDLMGPDLTLLEPAGLAPAVFDSMTEPEFAVEVAARETAAWIGTAATAHSVAAASPATGLARRLPRGLRAWRSKEFPPAVVVEVFSSDRGTEINFGHGFHPTVTVGEGQGVRHIELERIHPNVWF
ncbi:hypothetical protein [Actinocrinis sp.]|uniref:hypothetical protein n=1 Tax=Actinocrinis sp. TaxID=1920516 RepID=UPI002D800CF2|nr:hypothetical protein [Actinocrinis sp.]